MSSKFWFLVASFVIGTAAEDKGKSFSIFNVVTFKNEACVANAANDLKGTCYTKEECEEKGGTASGGCASGFGACCLFAVDECGGTAKENCTYIRNADWPNALTGAPENERCDFTVEKCKEEVCSLRLDFETFNIQAGNPATAASQDGVAACRDTFTVELTNNDVAIPVICGLNSDQHIFVEIGSDTSAQVRFTFEDVAATRQFEIKVTQYQCKDVGTLVPPGGCLQWHTGTSGQLTTFNWASNAQHLQLQDYDICIRQEKGFCCTEYSVCDQAGAFSLSVPTTATIAAIAGMSVGGTGTSCALDYVYIEGSSEVCGSSVHFNTYCGDVLSSKEAMGAVDSVICDCSAPFTVGIFTDGAAVGEDDGMGGDPQQSRGLCLEYKQKPC